MLTACILTEWDFVGNSALLKANIFMNLNSDHPTKILYIITTDKLQGKNLYFLPFSLLISLLHTLSTSYEVSSATFIKC